MTAVRVAGPGDGPTIAALRAQWTPDVNVDEDFEAQLTEWLAAEATAAPSGSSSTATTPSGWRRCSSTAEARGYARLVLSPTLRALPFYERAGFVVPDERAGEGDRLLVRPLT